MNNPKTSEGISIRISQALRLTETENILNTSQKSTNSADFNEISSIADQIETATPELRPHLTLKDILQNPYDKSLLDNYKRYFLIKKKGNRLLKHYSKENFRLIKSEIKHIDFSIKEVLLRLKTGYTVCKYGQKLRKYLKFIVDDSVLKIKTESRCYKIIPFNNIYGIVLGCETFNYKKSKDKIDKECGIIHNEYNCFSIVTETSTINLASNSEKIVYDVCLGVSWISYLYSEIPTSIAYTKCNSYKDTLSISMIRFKLNEIAKTRYMSIVELFILAICKTLKETGRSHKNVMKILNKRFEYKAKIYRFIVRSIVDVVREQQSSDMLKTSVRISLMTSVQNVPLKNIKNKTGTIRVGDCKIQAVNPLQLVAFFVPYSTSIFEKPKNENLQKTLERKRYASIMRHGSILIN